MAASRLVRYDAPHPTADARATGSRHLYGGVTVARCVRRTRTRTRKDAAPWSGHAHTSHHTHTWPAHTHSATRTNRTQVVCATRRHVVTRNDTVQPERTARQRQQPVHNAAARSSNLAEFIPSGRLNLRCARRAKVKLRGRAPTRRRYVHRCRQCPIRAVCELVTCVRSHP